MKTPFKRSRLSRWWRVVRGWIDEVAGDRWQGYDKRMARTLKDFNTRTGR